MTSLPLAMVLGTGAHRLTAASAYVVPKMCCHEMKMVAAPWLGCGHMENSYRSIELALDNYFLGRPGNLIGYSQGGLHAVRYAATHPNVRRIVSVCAPFAGTRWAIGAGWLPGLTRLTPAIADCTPGSQFLRQVQDYTQVAKPKLVCVWSKYDGVVVPGRSACVEGAFATIMLPWAINHLAGAIDFRLWRHLYAALEAQRDDQEEALPLVSTGPEPAATMAEVTIPLQRAALPLVASA